jgi:hypothetical protein
MCDVTLKHDEISMELKDVTLHILPSVSFDVILGFPCIRKNILLHIFSYLFSESNLQVVSSRPSDMPVAHLDPQISRIHNLDI